MSETTSRGDQWETVHQTKQDTSVRWYQEAAPRQRLEIIRSFAGFTGATLRSYLEHEAEPRAVEPARGIPARHRGSPVGSAARYPRQRRRDGPRAAGPLPYDRNVISARCLKDETAYIKSGKR